MKQKKENYKTKKPTAHYDLSLIRQLIDEGKLFIDLDDALIPALNDFGWNENEIKDAMKKLQRKHYYKTDDHRYIPGTKLDYYKAFGIKGEDIYTHFYIDDSSGRLIINSFHKI